MSNAVWFITYKLVKGASVPDFLAAAEELNNEFVSKKKGFIAWKQLVDGDLWADLMTWETMEDAKEFEKGGGTSPLAQKFYSFINFNSLKSQFFTVEKSY